MLQEKIGKLFNFISETNITEEYSYLHKGKYPVYSGQTENEGIVSFIDSYKQEGPCITFTTYGSAGKMFYRNGKYTIGRNCMGLKPKKKYLDKINLEWFVYMYQGLFYRLTIGETQKSLNKILLKNVIVQIPKLEVQERQLELYKNAKNALDKINKFRFKANNIINKSKVSYKNYKYEVNIKNLFNIKSGNTGLTKEFMYYNQPTNTKDSIRVYSGATQERNMMGTISKDAKPKGRDLKIFKGPCILVSRKGYAGTMKLIDDDIFTLNDDAYVLKVKNKWKDKLNIRWFIFQYQDLFYNILTSKSDNATFNKTYAQKQIIKLPKIEEQNKIADQLYKLDKFLKKVNNVEHKLNKLLECKIV